MQLRIIDICRYLQSYFRVSYEGAFHTPYNQYDGEEDYEFMLKMFNKRDKSTISVKQDKKIKAILLNSIKPFLQKTLAEKIR